MADGNSDVCELNGANQVSVQIGNYNRVSVASIKQELDKLPPLSVGPKCCIYRVPEKIRSINPYAYTPELVAIGPFHRDKLNLQAMEEYKLRYVEAILARTETPETKLEEYVNALSELEGIARECYSEPIYIGSHEFIRMMLVDGLFIVELLCRYFSMQSGHEEEPIFNIKEDPIFNILWIRPSLLHDMILLENQIPMFLLRKLFDLTLTPSEKVADLRKLALRFFKNLMPSMSINMENNYESNHLLDLVGNSIENCFRAAERKTDRRIIIPCVTKLQQAGVKLKKGDASCLLDIKFRNGFLEIPKLIIHDKTESFLRNLIASEQCCYGRDIYITSYALLMDNLIDSADDVELLCRLEIIHNDLGDNKNVSTLFNKLCLEVTTRSGFYYTELCEEVNKYYKARCHLYMATLRRNYFSTPWRVLSILFATILSIFTIVGTIFSILSFSIHKS